MSAQDSAPKARIVYQEFGTASSDSPQEDASALPPQQQNIRVQASRAGRKGKTVTILTGFQTSPAVLQQLLKQLKNQCGSGGTLKDNSIEIQGDHRPKILQVLLGLGYKAKISGG
ncbi:translation initiation factor [Synechocystis sp. LKSZ1]|uniref:translation initiation factor n=1 Tax=Synechocystis sp. LKSZ1 TaxID=3144951 RepID=UPI00336BBDE6